MRLLPNQIPASEGRSLAGAEYSPSDNNRRSLHEEDRHLNAHSALSECSYPDLDRRRRLDRRPRRGSAAGLIGRGARHWHFANQGTEAARNQTLGTEAASGGSRYSASAFKGLPPHHEAVA